MPTIAQAVSFLTRAMLNLTLLLQTGGAVHAQYFHAPAFDPLGVYFSQRTHLSETKILTYKFQSLHNANEMYSSAQNDPRLMLNLRREYFPGVADLRPTREDFLRVVSARMDQEINGLTLGATAVGKVGLLAFSHYLGRTAAGRGAPQEIFTKFGDKEIGERLSEISIIRPTRLDNVDVDYAYLVGASASKEIAEYSALGNQFRTELKNIAGIEQLKGLENSVEVKTFKQIQEQITSSEKTVEFQKGTQEQIAKAKEIVSEYQQILLKLYQASVNSEARVNAAKEAERQRRMAEESITAVRATFATMQLIGMLGNMSAEQAQILSVGSQATDAVMQLVMDTAQDPTSYMNGYYTLVKVGISLIAMNQQRGGDPFGAILTMLQSISDQIRDLRLEMHARFDALAGNIDRQFAENRDKLAELLQSLERNNALLNEVSARIEVSTHEVLQQVARLDEHRNDELLLKCQRNPTPTALEDCVARAILNSTTWALEDGADKDFNRLRLPELIFLGEAEAKPFQTEQVTGFHRLAPPYAKLRFKNELADRIPNTGGWLWGARLLTHLYRQNPEMFTKVTKGQLDSVIKVGRDAQTFYQQAFSESVNSTKFRVSTVWVADFLRDYIGLLKVYSDALSVSARSQTIPWTGTAHLLPEERSARDARAPAPSAEDFKKLPIRFHEHPSAQKLLAKRGHDDWPINSVAHLPRNSAAGRGVFNLLTSRDRYALVTTPLRFCEKEVTHLVPFNDFTGKHFRKAVASSDISRLRKAGLAVDASILSLIPRPALWLERIQPERFQVQLCVSEYAATFGRGIDLKNFRVTVPNSAGLKLRITLQDKQAPALMDIGTLSGGLRFWVVYDGPGEFGEGNFPNLTKSWTGMNRYGVQVGPIQGNMDRYFKLLPPTKGQQDALKLATDFLVSLKHALTNTFLKAAHSGGDVRTAYLDAEKSLVVLNGMYFLGASRIPEAEALFHDLSKSQVLNKPVDIAERLTDGMSIDSSNRILDEQLAELDERTRLDSKRIFDDPVPTPVDAELEELNNVRHLMDFTN